MTIYKVGTLAGLECAHILHRITTVPKTKAGVPCWVPLSVRFISRISVFCLFLLRNIKVGASYLLFYELEEGKKCTVSVSMPLHDNAVV